MRTVIRRIGPSRCLGIEAVGAVGGSESVEWMANLGPRPRRHQIVPGQAPACWRLTAEIVPSMLVSCFSWTAIAGTRPVPSVTPRR
jgi:hypothetical protein